MLKKHRKEILFAAIIFSLTITSFFIYGIDKQIIVYYSLLFLGILISIEDKLDKFKNKIVMAGQIWIYVLLALFITNLVLIKFELNLIYLTLPISLFFFLKSFCPLEKILLYWKPILISLFFPLSKLINYYLSPFAKFNTTKLSSYILDLMSIYHERLYNEIYFSGKKIVITDGCSGTDQLIFTITVILIFLLNYHLRSINNIFKILIYSIGISFFMNGIRISLLSVLFVKDNVIYDNLFKFLHDSYGSLVFSFLSVTLCSSIYLQLLNKELENENHLKNKNL